MVPLCYCEKDGIFLDVIFCFYRDVVMFTVSCRDMKVLSLG